MVICKYYQAGRCRYGNNCKFEHIDPPGGSRNNRSNDPFSAPNKRDKYRQNKSNDEEPQWPLTVIGIKDNAQQGNAVTGDWSPEELRAVAYSMAPRGRSNEVTQREAQLLSEHKAKVDAFHRSTGGQAQSSAGRNTQPQDPFAQNGGSGAQQQPFGQSFQQQPMGQAPQGANAFGQGQPFGSSSQPSQPFSQQQQVFSNPSQPSQPSQPQNAQAPLSAAAHEQFSAAQFGFSQVPESAPPPQFY